MKYTPTIHNVLMLWQWATGKPDSRKVEMSWCDSYSQAEALRWLRSRLHERLNRKAPLLADPRNHPLPHGRHFDSDFQLRLYRDGCTAKGNTQFRLNPSRRWQTDFVLNRLGP